MTTPLTNPWKKVLQEMHGKIGVLESMVEKIAAQQVTDSNRIAQLVVTNRRLADHVLRLTRQKESLLEAIGRQSLGGEIDYALIRPPAPVTGFKPSPMEPRI